MESRTIHKGEALTIWMAAVKHGDGGAHREQDTQYWRDAEVAFEMWWGKQTRAGLRRRRPNKTDRSLGSKWSK